MPTGSKIPKVHRVGVVFGEPLDFSRFEGLEGDRFVLRSITDEIMHEITRLGGQEYVDVYACTVGEFRRTDRVSPGRTDEATLDRFPSCLRAPRCSPVWTIGARSSQAAAGVARPDAAAAASPSSRRTPRWSSPARSTSCAPGSRPPLPATHSSCRVATAPRPSPTPPPTTSATGSRRSCRWPSCSPTAPRAGHQDGPDGRAVRQAALERHGDPGRCDPAGLPRRHHQRLRLHAPSHGARSAAPGPRLPHLRVDAEPHPRLHAGRLRRPAGGALLEQGLRLEPGEPGTSTSPKRSTTRCGSWRRPAPTSTR